MKKLLFTLPLILFASITQAGFFSTKCSEFGCLVVNGKKLPFSEAESLVYDCDNFRKSNVGRMAVNLSYSEIAKRTNSDLNHPLMFTFMNYMSIAKSPLVYSRHTKDKNLKYREIVQACVQLRRDFNTDRNWTK